MTLRASRRSFAPVPIPWLRLSVVSRRDRGFSPSSSCTFWRTGERRLLVCIVLESISSCLFQMHYCSISVKEPRKLQTLSISSDNRSSLERMSDSDDFEDEVIDAKTTAVNIASVL